MEDFSEEKTCLCAMNRIFGYEPRIASALLDCFGSAASVFRQYKTTISEVLGPWSGHADKICARSLDMAAAELEEARRLGVEFDPGEYEDYSVTGYVFYRLNRAPVRGDSVETGRVRITVKTVKGRRAVECVFAVSEPPQEEVAEE